MNKNFNITPIFIEDYDYLLPDERIAKYPLEQRDRSKLLLYQGGAISEDVFLNAPEYLPESTLLVCNNTRVIQARMIFMKETGARIEIFCLEPFAPVDYALSLSSTGKCSWKCLVGNLKKWKSGSLVKKITAGNSETSIEATLISTDENTHLIEFSWENGHLSFAEILDQAGELPIPPYLHRETEESDLIQYQTVYSRIKGSVAAPTAGLHFTPEVFEQLARKHIRTTELTLHVGAGTFQPVKSSDIADHRMHEEVISVTLESLKEILRNIGNIVAVGTTSVRSLESLYYIGLKISDPAHDNPAGFHVGQWEPYEIKSDISTAAALQAIIDYLTKNQLGVLHAQTSILIRPGFSFRIIRGMFTNFHQPKSTLLLLVSAFVGEDWKRIYDYSLQNDFRFLSYGDSSLLLR